MTIRLMILKYQNPNIQTKQINNNCNDVFFLLAAHNLNISTFKSYLIFQNLKKFIPYISEVFKVVISERLCCHVFVHILRDKSKTGPE